MSQISRLDLVLKAICAGFQGQIEWQPSCLERFLGDPEMRGFTDKGIRKALCDFVRNQGGTLECRRETDPDWLREHEDDPWWYFAIIPVPEFRDGLFVKVKLLWKEGDDEHDAFVQILSIHEERRL